MKIKTNEVFHTKIRHT